MLTKKKKITKKNIKEDKLVTTYYKTVGFFNDNSQKIYLYGGILVAIIVAVFFYEKHISAQNSKASLELSRVMNLYQNGAYQQAIDGQPNSNIIGLKKIVEQYGSTETGETAKIFLANCYNMLGKYDEAFKYFDDYDGSIKMYKATSLAGKANYYAVNKEYLKAANAYKEAAFTDKNDALNSDYLLSAGINFLKVNKNDDAKEMFQKIKDEYKTTSAYREVDRYMAMVD